MTSHHITSHHITLNGIRYSGIDVDMEMEMQRVTHWSGLGPLTGCMTCVSPSLTRSAADSMLHLGLKEGGTRGGEEEEEEEGGFSLALLVPIGGGCVCDVSSVRSRTRFFSP